MVNFWNCKSPTWFQYYHNIEYISDPSINLIEEFKKAIITCEDPKTHPDYIECDHVGKNMGHMLFILANRVKIIINPVEEEKILYFINCNDNQ